MNEEIKIDRGIPVPPRRTKESYDPWSDEEIAYLRARWGEDHPITIAAHLGRGFPTIRRMARELGLRSKGRSRSYDLRPRPLTEAKAISAARKLWVMSMRRAGYTLQECADRLGISRQGAEQFEKSQSQAIQKSQRVPLNAGHGGMWKHGPCINGKINHRWVGETCGRCGLAIRDVYAISKNLGA
jgi:hypothetical protein